MIFSLDQRTKAPRTITSTLIRSNSLLQMPIRGNIAYDQADKVKWSPDSKGNYSKSEMALIDLIALAIELKIN